jgi:hypothetical protein
MATPARRATTAKGSYLQESVAGTSITAAQAAGGATSGDLMCYIWVTASNTANVASNTGGYTKQWETTHEWITVSMWTKEHDGTETGDNTWTMDSGYDDGSWVSFSMYNLNSTDPIAGWAFDTDTTGPIYTCPDVTVESTSEMFSVRMLASDAQASRGDDNSTTWEEVLLFAGDSSAGGALTVTSETSQSSTTVGTYDIDATQNGTNSSRTITVVFAGENAYPSGSPGIAGEGFTIANGAAF